MLKHLQKPVAFTVSLIHLEDSQLTKDRLALLANTIPALTPYTTPVKKQALAVSTYGTKLLAFLAKYHQNFEPRAHHLPHANDPYKSKVFVSFQGGVRKVVLPFIHENPDVARRITEDLLPDLFHELFGTAVQSYTVMSGSNLNNADQLGVTKIK